MVKEGERRVRGVFSTSARLELKIEKHENTRRGEVQHRKVNRGVFNLLPRPCTTQHAPLTQHIRSQSLVGAAASASANTCHDKQSGPAPAADRVLRYPRELVFVPSRAPPPGQRVSCHSRSNDARHQATGSLTIRALEVLGLSRAGLALDLNPLNAPGKLSNAEGAQHREIWQLFREAQGRGKPIVKAIQQTWQNAESGHLRPALV
ncbi:hypothetical protein B0J14DRAFT_657776 [Halenospora varia]|nr:hypothetical protein B0J14DRAFT_657776 [Halenospora varia]